MSPATPPKEVMLRLREAALGAVELGLPAPPAEHPTVYGAVIDIEADGDRFATLVAMGEGSTSLYTSGKTIIGGGGHAEVRRATRALLEELETRVPSYEPIADTRFPPPGTVRFHVLTPTGRRYRDVPSDVFWGRVPGPLPPHVAAVQQLVAALHGAETSHQPDGPG